MAASLVSLHGFNRTTLPHSKIAWCHQIYCLEDTHPMPTPIQLQVRCHMLKLVRWLYLNNVKESLPGFLNDPYFLKNFLQLIAAEASAI